MGDKINLNPLNANDLIGVISSDGFNKLPERSQKQIIDLMNSNQSSEGGWMGKIFGNKKENAAMNIAFTICLIMAIIGIVCMCLNHECWDVIIPAIMTAVGYMFGVGVKN